jgi:transcriptional regulator with XRE-family HTH domain
MKIVAKIFGILIADALYLDNYCQDLNLSMVTQQTFGETLRKLREDDGMPLRKLAALLDIDQSTLSKIERNERKANPDMIDKLSKIFKADKKELHISFVSDKVVYELLDEESSIDILKVAEEKISYIKQSKKKPNAK